MKKTLDIIKEVIQPKKGAIKGSRGLGGNRQQQREGEHKSGRQYRSPEGIYTEEATKKALKKMKSGMTATNQKPETINLNTTIDSLRQST